MGYKTKRVGGENTPIGSRQLACCRKNNLLNNLAECRVLKSRKQKIKIMLNKIQPGFRIGFEDSRRKRLSP